MNKDDLNFTPLSEGLGFHPFADGLPYAPVNPAPTSNPHRTMGSGAVSAGRPQISPSITHSVRVFPLATARISPTFPVTRPARALAPPAPAVAPPPGIINEEFNWAYPIKRAIAFVLDAAINSSFIIAAFAWVLTRSSLHPEALASSGIVGLTALFVLFFNWALIAAQEVALSTTIGKRVFGLSIDGTPGKILLRSALFIPSFAFSGLGLFWCLFDDRRRCWHDVASGLQPREIARL